MQTELKMAALDFIYTDKSVGQRRQELKNEVRSKLPSKNQTQKQMLVDVSVIIKGDVRTGIQRVVRAILSEFLSNPPEGFNIVPVFANTAHSYHYAPEDFNLAKNNAMLDLSTCKRVNTKRDDVFLALDLATQQLPKHQAQLERWKRKGVAIHVMVYDLLPVLHPEWFHSRTTRNFYRWLRTLAIVTDSAICISNSVKNDLTKWLKAKYSISSTSLPIKIITMGCDLESSVPSLGLPADSAKFLKLFAEAPSALMVGTLEPRKGHEHVLDAFECLWRDGKPYNLVIVGKSGWKTERLQARLREHSEYNRRLFWFDDASDEYLNHIYQSIFGLIVASEGEGFGLPLIEALKHNKALLVRDLPVFKELNIPTMYFKDDGAQSLSKVIHAWFTKSIEYINQVNTSYSVLWRDTAKDLLSQIDIDNKKCIDLIKQTKSGY